MPSLLGNGFRRLYLSPRAKNKDWKTLVAGAVQARQDFEAVWGNLSEQEIMTPVRRAELACIGDVLSHLTTANRGMAAHLEKIAAGETSREGGLPPDLFAGTAGKSCAEVRREYERACQALEQRLQESDLSAATATRMHPFFGPLTGREWAFMVAVHFGYHIRQVRGFRKKLAARNRK